MNSCHRVIAWFVIALVACALAVPAWAQQPKPKTPKAEKPAAEKPAKPAAPKPEKKSGGKKPPAEEEAAPEDPAVAAILESKPATPAECVTAAKTLTDLGHVNVAKPLLKKVLDAKLDAKQLADLGEQFGSIVFLDMAGQAGLMPEAKQLADAVMAALAARLQDAKRIAGLIGQLQDPEAQKRAEALVGLQEARAAAVAPLLAVLADPARSAEHAGVRAVLATMGRPARDALAAIVEQADPKLVVQAILALAGMHDPNTVLALLRPCMWAKSDTEVRATAAAVLKQLTGGVPSRPEAVRLLGNAAKTYFDGRQPIEGVVDGKAELWQWDGAKRQCVARRCTPEDAARALAVHWARDACALAPDDARIRVLYLTTMLEAAAYDKGLDPVAQPPPAVQNPSGQPRAAVPQVSEDPAVVEAKRFGVKTLDEVLGYAMAHRHPAAAAAAARLLGEIGKTDEVLYQGDKPAALALAVQNPDRRVRMAALEAIVRLKPSKPYAGSSYVPSALAFFAASSGVRHALAAGPSTAQARDLAGMLAAAGYQTDTATAGKELLHLAARSPDYELAFIDVTIDHPEIGMLLQELRHDPRTASLRVGLIARASCIKQADRLARADPMCKSFARPHDAQAFRWQLAELAALAPREFVDFAVRQRQAAESLDLLAELSRSSRRLYDVRRVQDSVLAALYNPKLAAKAVAVLAELNSAESQRALVDIASRFTQPLALRQAAAKAFRQNTEQHGILLTTAEIRQQYRRYNESRDQDPATQHVLGLILDCLEAPSQLKK